MNALCIQSNRGKLAKAAREEPQCCPAKHEQVERGRFSVNLIRNAFGDPIRNWLYVDETKRNLGNAPSGWREFTAYNNSNLTWFNQPIKVDNFLLRYKLKYLNLPPSGKRAEPRDKNSVVVICGTGIENIGDLKSGYSFCFGTAQGKNAIMRLGSEVASTYFFHPVGGREYLMEIQKVGGKIKWFVDGGLLLEYDDSQPLPSGFLGFGSNWSTRVRYGEVEIWGEKK